MTITHGPDTTMPTDTPVLDMTHLPVRADAIATLTLDQGHWLLTTTHGCRWWEGLPGRWVCLGCGDIEITQS